MDEQKLLDLKQKIDRAKTKVAELTGRQDRLMEELQKGWDCSSKEKAQQVLKDIEDKIAEINEKITKGIQELKEQYDV